MNIHALALRGHAIRWGCGLWREIVEVAAGANHTLGLRADGYVLATGSNEYGQSDVNGWSAVRRPV